MKKNKSIATSIRFWMIVVAIAPLLIMSIQGYHCARQAVLQLKMDQLETVTEAKRQTLKTWLTERTRELQAHTTGRDLTTCTCGTAELLNINPAYESITLFSNGWKRIAFAGPENHSDEMLLPNRFKRQLESEQGSAISTPHLHENGLIGIHIGVADPAHSRYAVAVLDLTTTLYPTLAQPIGSDRNIRTFITTPDGRMLSPLNGSFQSLENNILPPKHLQHTDHLMPYIGLDGERVIGVALPLEPLGWTLVSEAPTRDAFAWVGILRKRAALTGLVTLILVVLFARQSAQRLTRPLRHLAEVAHHVSEGHYTSRMQTFPGREHAEVAHAFNQMLDEIDRAQARLAQTAALSAIGQLSASIVHEMRNPLSAIKMNLEVLQHAAQDDPVHRELGEIAAEQVLRLETMLGDLLQYGKKVELVKTRVPIDEFFREIKACIRHEEDKPVELIFRNDSKTTTLTIDREQMLRAVSNLIDNAVQSSPGGGTVRLVLRTDPAHTAELLLEVSDQGPGISDRVAEKLFEPFFTTRKKGTGLGLANVKKIVELHGGSIAFRNINPGTKFIIALPAEQEMA